MRRRLAAGAAMINDIRALRIGRCDPGGGGRELRHLPDAHAQGAAHDAAGAAYGR